MGIDVLSQVASEDAAKIALGVASLARAPTLDDLSLELLALCDSLVSGDQISYTELDPYFGRTVQHSTSPEFDAEIIARWEVWHEVMLTQPLILHYKDNPGDRPRRMSDIVDDQELRNTAFWSEIMRSTGTNRQLVLHLGLEPLSGGATAPMMAGINVNRSGRDFEDREVAALALVEQLVRPIFRLKRAETRKAQLLQQDWGPEAERLLRSFGLTSREAEVAFWMLRGHSNPEIADILRISTATARQHTMSVFSAIGASGRGAFQTRFLTAIWAEN